MSRIEPTPRTHTAGGATLTERALSQEADPARRAGLLNNLANRLSDLGRREEALGVAQEALDLRRTLAAANPQAFTPDLAVSLGKLSRTKMEAGLWNPALEANTEAVELFASLAQGLPAVYGTYLRTALEDRVSILTAIGDHCSEPDDSCRGLRRASGTIPDSPLKSSQSGLSSGLAHMSQWLSDPSPSNTYKHPLIHLIPSGWMPTARDQKR